MKSIKLTFFAAAASLTFAGRALTTTATKAQIDATLAGAKAQ